MDRAFTCPRTQLVTALEQKRRGQDNHLQSRKAKQCSGYRWDCASLMDWGSTLTSACLFLAGRPPRVPSFSFVNELMSTHRTPAVRAMSQKIRAVSQETQSRGGDTATVVAEWAVRGAGVGSQLCVSPNLSDAPSQRRQEAAGAPRLLEGGGGRAGASGYWPGGGTLKG